MSSTSHGTSPVPSVPGGVARSGPQPLPARFILGLALGLLAAWQLPLLMDIKHSPVFFPVSVHTITEFASMVAALLVFSVAWHARNPNQQGSIVIIGCGMLAVGLIDFGHTLSYKGMPDMVTPSGPEKAIQFWLVARYAAALTLVVASFRPIGPLQSERSRRGLLAGALALTALVYALELSVPDLIWPRTFIDGQGQTLFKIAAEYGVILLSGVAAFRFYRARNADTLAYNTTDLCAAALITILSELALTMYVNVYDLFGLMGHLYKIAAYYFIYRAVFVNCVRDPYQRLSVEAQERREAQERVEFLALHDALTQLPNRDLARDRLAQAMADAHRFESLVALVYLDLDHFKAINDSIGHASGDQMLKVVASILRTHVRKADTVCRLGGDEFVLILRNLPNLGAVAPIVSKLIEEVSRPLMIHGQELSTSASAGIAMAPGDGEEFDVLLQRAETAMYRAKEEGRNTFRFFDDQMNHASLERLTMRNGLRKAIDQGQFVLFYQPQIDLIEGRVIGVEALIRWQHPEWGLVPPGKFIPVAEESGLIVPIGDWVIEEACRQGKRWQQQGLPAMTVAVNLSALQFKRGNVEDVVSQALAASGLAAHHLELELTESVLISEPDSVEVRLKALKALGVKLAIDDFGTGYSSLSYLKRFSVDKLKIDQSFVRDLEKHPDEVAIVRAIIQMANSLGLNTIAEGVETQAVGESLRALGCREAQGYWYAKPMPAAALEDWLHQFLARRQVQAQPAEVTEATT
jgi:diguanylate cyclase (GGDEF)-like protein